MICNCKVHRKLIVNCESCFELISSCALLLGEVDTLQTSLSDSIQLKQRLLEEKSELLNTLSIIKEKLCLKNPLLPKHYIHEEELLDYIKSLVLPNNFLTLIYDSELALSFLLQKGLISPVYTCNCGKKPNIKKKNKHYVFVCDCGKTGHYTNGTIWKDSEVSPSKAVLILFLWVMNLTSSNIAQISCLDHKVVRSITDQVRGIISDHYKNTLPKFRGVVEIDESCFKTGRDKYNRFLKDRWVFGLYERERKLVYMEVVQKRNAKTLIPIIKERCEVGTTIISDQWGAYRKLDECGFPHYTVDHSRFFVNPNSREIHTQNIEISWCWAKYNIKKHSNTAPLQQLLHIFSWMRQFKSHEKGQELATVLNKAAEILSEFQKNRYEATKKK